MNMVLCQGTNIRILTYLGGFRMSRENDNEIKSSHPEMEEDKNINSYQRSNKPWNSKFNDNENLKNRQYSRAARNQPVKEASKLSQILLLLITLLVLIPFILFGIFQSQIKNKEITSRTTNEIMISRSENASEESKESQSKDESKTTQNQEKTTDEEISSIEIEETTPAPVPEPEPIPEPEPQPQTSGTVHTVSAGESWWAIARTYGVDPYELASYNGSTIDTALYPGLTVQIP